MNALSANRLLVLDGPPGSGKTSALQFIETLPPTVARVLPKLRTGGREPKPGEYTADYIRLSDAEYDWHAATPDFYGYRFGTDRYGFHQADLEALIASTRSAVVVVRSTPVIRSLQTLKGIDVVPVLVSTPLHVIRERLDDGEATRRRLARAAEFAADFDPTIYRAALRNDGSRHEFEAALHQLLDPAAEAA